MGEAYRVPKSSPESQRIPSSSRHWVTTSPRVHPLTPHVYRYRPIWLRAVRKLQAQFGVNALGKEIQLYGANTLREDRSEMHTQAEAFKKALQLNPISPFKEILWVFEPGGAFKLVWSGVYAVLMFYTAIIMPFRMAFYEETQEIDGWFVVDNIVNALFFVDILITLNTAIYSEEGALVTSHRAIFMAYLCPWLVIDLAACIPFYLIRPSDDSSNTNSSQLSRMLRLLRLPRLYRLLRLARILSAMKRDSHNSTLERLQECLSVKHATLRFVFFILSFVLAVHLMACLWYFVPAMEGLGVETWVVRYGIEDESVGEKYVNCVYWAMTTLSTVGYGDIAPYTISEKIITILWMLFGVCFFSFIVGSVATAIHSSDSKRNMLAGKLAAIDEFAADSKLSKDLRYRLRYALRYSTIRTGFSPQVKQDIFSELPRSLRFEVAISMHRGCIRSLPFFMDRDQAFIAATVPFLNSLQSQPAEFIYTEGDYADEIYFIVNGACAVMWQDLVMKKYQKAAYFGDIEVIFTIQRKHSVQAMGKLDLLSMGKKVLETIQTDFPGIFEEMKEIANVRDQLNEKAKNRFQKLFANSRKVVSNSDRKKKKIKPEIEITRPKSEMLSQNDRLSTIESDVKDIRRIVISLAEGRTSMPAFGYGLTFDGDSGAAPSMEIRSAEAGQFLYPGQEM